MHGIFDHTILLRGLGRWRIDWSFHLTCFPCFYAPQVYTRPFTCIDRATNGNTGEFDIRRGTSADPRPLRASSTQQDYSAGEGIVEESYNRGSYMIA